MAQIVARRARRQATLPTEDDFAPDHPQAGATARLARPLVLLLAAGLLGLGTALAVATASAPLSTRQNLSSWAVDPSAPDQSRGAPAVRELTAEQAAVRADDSATTGSTSAGGLQAFDQRGTTVNRNSVRSALDQVLVGGTRSDRDGQLRTTSTRVALTQAQAQQVRRERQLQADLAKVQAEQGRILAEKKKAEELLARLGAVPGEGVNLGDLTAVVSSGATSMPLAPGTYRVGAHFGQVGPWASYHTGQDFPAAHGTPIRAVVAGVVGSPIGAWWPGNHVVVHHAHGGSTLYAHMSRSAVRPGQVVAAGQVIGYVGSTGNSYGNHLHLEYYPAGTTPGNVYAASNPMAFLRSIGVRP